MSKLTRAFKHQRERVALILCLKGYYVIVPSALKNFRDRCEVQSQGEASIAAVKFKAIVSHQKGYQRHMAGIHSLRRIKFIVDP